jgi:hypothetical protein
MSGTHFQATSRSWFWWNLCLSRQICLMQNLDDEQYHSKAANSSHERRHRIFIRIARRRRIRDSISHVWIWEKWRSRMQAKKSFVWSETNIKNVIRYHTRISDRFENSDYVVFIDSRTKIYLAMYVDDLLLFDLNLNHLQNIQNKLKQRFKMTNLRQLSHYLDMKIIINQDQLILIQSIYLKKMFNQFEMKNCRSVSIFMKSEMINSLMSITNEADNVIVKWYQQLIESLM